MGEVCAALSAILVQLNEINLKRQDTFKLKQALRVISSGTNFTEQDNQPLSLSSFRKQRHRLALRQMADISNRTTNNVHGMAPPYLASYCTPVTSQTGRSNLRSVATGQLIVPRTRTAYGSRSFAIHGPVVWNSLPAELRSPDISLDVFRKQLKTFLFNC